MLGRGLPRKNRFPNHCRQVLNQPSPLMLPKLICHSCVTFQPARCGGEICHLHGGQECASIIPFAIRAVQATCLQVMQQNLLLLDKRLRQSLHTTRHRHALDLQLALALTSAVANLQHQPFFFCCSNNWANLPFVVTSATPNLLRSIGVNPNSDSSLIMSPSTVFNIPNSGFAYA